MVDGHDVVPDVHEVLGRMATFADRVRSGDVARGHRRDDRRPSSTSASAAATSARRWPILATEAFGDRNLRCRFVSNVDGADITGNLADLDPATTLFIVSSKTFTTIETLTNAARGPPLADGAARRATRSASTSSPSAPTPRRSPRSASTPANMFGFWDWVGGRYSVDSAIGLSLMLSIGPGAVPPSSSTASTPSTATSCEAPLHVNAPVMHGDARHLVRQRARCRDQGGAAVRPRAAPLPRLPAAARHGVATARACASTAQPVTTTTGPDRVGRAGHQRPARVLPTAAPGHAAGADRLHRLRPAQPSAARPARPADGQPVRPGRGAGVRQDARRGDRRGHPRAPAGRIGCSPATVRAPRSWRRG